jgi:DNA polymerase-3 subunit beta
VETTLQSADTSEFPAFPEISGEKRLIKSSDFSEISSMVLPSTSPDLARPLLTGIVFEPDPDGTIVATDGFRLSLLKSQISSSEKWGERVIIPARFINELKKLFDLGDEVLLQYSSEQKQIFAGLKNVALYGRILEGEYPPYLKILPESSKTTIKLKSDELEEHIKRAVIFARDSMNAIQFVFSSDSCKVKAQSSSLGQFSAVLTSAVFEGEPLEIAFNSKYILDFLQAAPTEDIQMDCTDQLKPVLFSLLAKPEWKYVVMPFRLTK